MKPALSKHYRQSLQSVLVARLAVNPRYSLRAFARDLKLSPSFLSQVLSGKRGLAPQSAERVFTKCGFLNSDSEVFLLQVREEQLRSAPKKQKLQQKIEAELQKRSAQVIDFEKNDVLSEWFSLTLLQMLALPHSLRLKLKGWVKWAASKLDLDARVVEAAVKALMDQRLVEIGPRGLMATTDTVWTTSGVPSEAIRRYHRQMMDRAKASIDLQTVEERFFHSIQLPVRKDNLPQFQAEILKFRNQMLRKYGRTQERDADHVYAMNVQLFKLI